MSILIKMSLWRRNMNRAVNAAWRRFHLWATRHPIMRHIGLPLLLLISIFFVGSFGYYILGRFLGHSWSFIDCAFMTSISLTTVGYGDNLGVTEYEIGRIYTMGLLVVGMGATAYSISELTAFLVEGELRNYFKETRMEKVINDTKNHIILCGLGTTGIHVLEELQKTGRTFVVVERERERIMALLPEYPKMIYVVGDANKEEVLEKAGIHRANSIVASLSQDKDNLFLLVTAKYLNPNLRIIVKCLDHDSVGKFKAAGAAQVVSPTFIGGLRMASYAVRPHVVDFLDNMMRSDNADARVSEAIIDEKSKLVGKTIAESHIEENVGLRIVALRHSKQEPFLYSPPLSTTLKAGTALVVVGPLTQVEKLEKLVAAD